MMIKRFTLLFALITLSGCALFSPIKSDTITQYQLTAMPHVVVAKHPRHASLFVAQPYAAGVINSIQMAYVIAPYKIAYFTKNRWADLPSSMLMPLMVTTLQQTHYFHAVGSSGQSANYDYYLNTELLEFQQMFFTQHSIFRVSLRAQLVNAHTNRIIGSRLFTVEEIAPQYGPYGGAIAANQAVAKILAELAKWAAFNT